MNTEDYTQIQLRESALDRPDLMKEGEVVTVLINTEDNMPLSVEMPASVILEVTATEPGVKGNTATNATKPATVETGAKLMFLCLLMKEIKLKLKPKKELIKNVLKNNFCEISKNHIL